VPESEQEVKEPQEEEVWDSFLTHGVKKSDVDGDRETRKTVDA